MVCTTGTWSEYHEMYLLQHVVLTWLDFFEDSNKWCLWSNFWSRNGIAKDCVGWQKGKHMAWLILPAFDVCTTTVCNQENLVLIVESCLVWGEVFPFSSFLVGSGFAFTAPNWFSYILHRISITSASPHGYHLQLQNRLLAEETLILLACSSLWKKLRWCLVLWPRNCIVLWLFLYSYILYFNVDIINVFCWFFKGITERWRVLCILTVEY